ncbi:MFS transporter [Streptomyces sp. NPDC021622]|uniref:MFS transporter n=1 Tax=Streptomyces sp. NPDC021622 TaxID=3155013 RepID=UPI003410DA17
MTSTLVSPETVRPRMTNRQVAALVLLLTSQFLMAADFSLLNVALPSIGVELGFTQGGLQWIATAFALCAAGFTLVFGRVGDYAGRRRVFIGGMAVLAVASAAGGFAQSPTPLLVARALQGLATAAITPVSMALLTTTFTEPRLRARALGLNSVMMSSGFVFGSIFGGSLTDLLSWRWAFFINIPVAVAAICLIRFVVPESVSDERRSFDTPGAVLITAGMFGIIYGVTDAAAAGFTALNSASLLGGCVLIGVFWAVEKRTTDALVPVRVLRIPDVAIGNATALFIFGGETALIYFTGIYVQDVLHYSPLASGLVLLGIGVGQILAGSFGPRVIEAVSPRTLLGLAVAGQGAFMLPMVWATEDPGWLAWVIAAQFVNGAFSMLALISFMMIATSAVSVDLQGMATGVATQSQQVGQTIGIPLVSSVFVASAGAAAAGSGGQLHGIHVALLVDALTLVGVGALVFLVFRLRGRAAPATVEE